MARKHGVAKMTLSTQGESDELEALALKFGYSHSDLLRHAVTIAFKTQWPVPLWRRAEEELKPQSVRARKYRARKNKEK
jgi:hypothetical protein